MQLQIRCGVGGDAVLEGGGDLVFLFEPRGEGALVSGIFCDHFNDARADGQQAEVQAEAAEHQLHLLAFEFGLVRAVHVEREPPAFKEGSLALKGVGGWG